MLLLSKFTTPFELLRRPSSNELGTTTRRWIVSYSCIDRTRLLIKAVSPTSTLWACRNGNCCMLIAEKWIWASCRPSLSMQNPRPEACSVAAALLVLRKGL